LAVLDDIREDTNILATDVVRKRLEERLRDLRVSRANIVYEYDAALVKAKSSMAGEGCGASAVGALSGAFVGWVVAQILGGDLVGGFSLLGALVGASAVGWSVE